MRMVFERRGHALEGKYPNLVTATRQASAAAGRSPGIGPESNDDEFSPECFPNG